MLPPGRAHADKVFLLVLAALHLSAASTADLATTVAPEGSNSTLTNSTADADGVEGSKVVHPYTPCGGDYAHYCGNGGQCIFPQDTDKPSCICTSSFKGERCLFFSDHSHSLPEPEQVVAITLGVAMLVCALAVVAICVLRRRCVKSAPLKLAPDSSA